MATITSKIDDTTRIDASSSSQIPIIEASEFAIAVDQLDVSSLASSLTLPEESTHFLSPVQVGPPAKQRHSFSLSDLLNGTEGGLEALGPEVAAAELNIAADGRFIEASSGPAVRELKRRYDQLAGVGGTIRSPYAITAFVNQHGKSMYRLGHRDEHSAPAATAAEAEDRMTQAKVSNDPSHSPRSKRRSRLSMNFLPPNFMKNSLPLQPPSGRAKVVSTSTAPKKLHRKTGSTPDLIGTTAEDLEQTGSSATTFAITGRGHSQSVTAADMARPSVTFQPVTPKTDAFGELLDLGPSLNGSMPIISVSTDPNRPRGTILQPFGPGVAFTAPNNSKGIMDRLRPPRQLREMQSFESTMTAKQDDHLLAVDELSELDHEPARPPSAVRLSQFMPLVDALKTPQPLDPTSDLDEETSPESPQLSSQYSTDVFNVLQKYSGLPVFESLVPEVGEGTTVIRLSLSTDTNAAPRDDPRFVIWGEFQPEYEFDDSNSRDSLTEMSSHSSTLSRKKSNRTSRLKSPDSSFRLGSPEGGQRVLLAATIERWIAQLTSDLNYDELLNFFLTYRTYISGVDLCHLLIGRFLWTLQKATSREDETVHRIVRVRTFVAMRYWMLTFFTVDFIPNRELRLVIADWLNTMLHDPALKKHMDGIGIVRRLIKVAKDCKKAHTKATDKPKAAPSRQVAEPELNHVLGKSFARATRKDEDQESDLDLDFLPDEATTDEVPSSDPANAHITVGHVAAGVALSQGRPTSLPLSSFNTLQRAEHTSAPNVGPDPPVATNVHTRDSALSRAFVGTIGRLGRWKRVFKPRSPTLVPKVVAPLVCGSVSAFDLELNGPVDLLTTEHGVEEYLKMAESPTGSSTTLFDDKSQPPTLSAVGPLPTVANPPSQLPITPPSASLVSVLPKQIQHPESPSVNPSTLSVQASPHADPVLPSPPPSPIAKAVPEASALSDTTHVNSIARDQLSNTLPAFVSKRTSIAQSFRSSSTDSFGEPLTSDGPLSPTFPGTHSQWKFDVVSIDDLDISDTSSLHDPPHPPGLRKQKKLPMRRDFEFVRRSEVSSMGIISHESMRDSINSVSPTSSGGAGPKPIQRWQMKSLQQTFEELSNNSDDKGDVEAALRRLEGQINPKVLVENAEKVNGWVRNLQDRMANGDYANSTYSEDEIEDFIDEIDAPTAGSQQEVFSATEGGEDVNDAKGEADTHTPMPTQTMQQLPTPPSVDVSPKDVQSDVEAVVPVEILQSRMSLAPLLLNTTTGLPAGSRISNPPSPRAHCSFILNFSAEQLAQHFSMIDRELFMSVKFEELVTGEWLEGEEIEILEWAQYLKDRARWKAESRHCNKTTALAAVRARFNLTVSFVNAEVVLTPPNERPFVVGKFIRVAWHCYQLSNFQTLTAIMTGLQSDWVTKAMRIPGWSRLGVIETRMLRDLKQFTSKQDDFKFMRQAVDFIADSKRLESNSRTPSIIGSANDSQSGMSKPGSDTRPTAPSTCIPFIGIYLSQLRRLNKLPALIDPTSPNTLVSVDPVTANFDSLAHPEVFTTLTPLPLCMHLEPLINVHKQRCIAEVIKSLVAGQHLASPAHFDVDRKLFQKCLRLRGFDSGYLQRALNLHAD